MHRASANASSAKTKMSSFVDSAPAATGQSYR